MSRYTNTKFLVERIKNTFQIMISLILMLVILFQNILAQNYNTSNKITSLIDNSKAVSSSLGKKDIFSNFRITDKFHQRPIKRQKDSFLHKNKSSRNLSNDPNSLNQIQLGKMSSTFIYFDVNKDGDLYIFSFSGITSKPRYFYSIKKNGQMNFFDEVGNPSYYKTFPIAPTKNSGINKFIINSNNNKEYFLSFEPMGSIELYDFNLEPYSASSVEKNSLFGKLDNSEKANMFQLKSSAEGNYLYLYSSSYYHLEGDESYLFLYVLKFNSNNLEDSGSVSIVSIYDTLDLQVLCQNTIPSFETENQFIEVFYMASDGVKVSVFTETLNLLNTNVLDTFVFGKSHNILYVWCFHLKDEVGVFLYYIDNTNSYLRLRILELDSSTYTLNNYIPNIAPLGYITINKDQYYDYDQNYDNNEFIKVSEKLFALFSINKDLKTSTLTLFELNDDLTNLQVRYFILSFKWKTSTGRAISHGKGTVYNGYLIYGFYMSEYRDPIFMILNYCNITASNTIITINGKDVIFSPSFFIKIENNIFQYYLTGIKIVNVPEISGVNILLNNTNSPVENDTILSLNENIIIQLTNKIPTGIYYFEYYGMTTLPSREVYDALFDGIEQFPEGASGFYNPNNHIGRTIRLTFVFPTEIDEVCDSGCEVCLHSNLSECLKCDEMNDYILFPPTGECLNEPPLGYYYNTTEKIFKECHPDCGECSGDPDAISSNCETCIDSSKSVVSGNCEIKEEKSEEENEEESEERIEEESEGRKEEKSEEKSEERIEEESEERIEEESEGRKEERSEEESGEGSKEIDEEREEEKKERGNESGIGGIINCSERITQCPPEENLLIRNKNKCVSSCLLDDTYKYQYNSECLMFCPNETKSDDLYICREINIDLCKLSVSNLDLAIEELNDERVGRIAKNYANEFDYTNNHISQFKNEYYEINFYKSEECMNELAKNSTKVDFDNCVENLKEKYSLDNVIISTLDIFNVGDSNSPSLVYNFYDPNSGEKLNIEGICDDEIIRITRLPLELPQINLTLVQSLIDQNINIFDINGKFFTDLCYHFDTPNGKDMTLKDRILEFYPNVTLCSKGCTNKGFNIETYQAICECKFQEKFIDENIDSFIFETDAYKLISESNIEVLKCYKDVFDMYYFKKNIGGFVTIGVNFILLICTFYFFKKSFIITVDFLFMAMVSYIKKMVGVGGSGGKNNTNNKENNNNDINALNLLHLSPPPRKEKFDINNINNENFGNKIDNNNLPTEKKEECDKQNNNNGVYNNNQEINESNINPTMKNKKKKKKKRKGQKKESEIKIDSLSIDISNKKSLQNSKDIFRSSNFENLEGRAERINELNNSNKINIIKPEILNNYNINNKDGSYFNEENNEIYNQKSEVKFSQSSLEDFITSPPEYVYYESLLTQENKSFCKLLGGKIKEKQMIINFFSDNNFIAPKPIKLFMIILSFDIYLIINCFLFNESYISDLYHSTKKESFFSFFLRGIDKIVYASIINKIIDSLIFFFFPSENKIRRTLSKNKNNESKIRQEMLKIILSIKKQYILFVLIGFIISIFSWYYISCFCNVYPHTQFEWLKSSIFIFLIMQAISFIQCFAYTFFRYFSVKFENEVFYKYSENFA